MDNNKYQMIEKNDKLITWIIVCLAAVLTAVSLSMIAVSSWERTANDIESIIMTFLAGSIALSAHLLPALTKRRVGKIGGMVVTVLWLFSVLVTLYSHTVFFVSAGVHAGEVRSQKSGKVEDIKETMSFNQQEINDPNVRSVVLISRDMSVVDGRIAALQPRDCDKCKTTKSKIAELQAQKNALNIEMQESQRIANLKAQQLSMNSQIMNAKDSARLDPVTQKLSLIFKGMNVDALTLFLAILSAGLLETLAALFWWLVWPNRKISINEEAFFSVAENNNIQNKSKKKTRKSENEPLFNKEAVSALKKEDNLTEDQLAIQEHINIAHSEELPQTEQENISAEKQSEIQINRNINLKRKRSNKQKIVKGYQVVSSKAKMKPVARMIRQNFASSAPIMAETVSETENAVIKAMEQPVEFWVKPTFDNQPLVKSEEKQNSENVSQQKEMVINKIENSNKINTEKNNVRTDYEDEENTDPMFDFQLPKAMFEEKLEVDISSADKNFKRDIQEEESVVMKKYENRNIINTHKENISSLVNQSIKEVMNTKAEDKVDDFNEVFNLFDNN